MNIRNFFPRPSHKDDCQEEKEEEVEIDSEVTEEETEGKDEEEIKQASKRRKNISRISLDISNPEFREKIKEFQMQNFYCYENIINQQTVQNDMRSWIKHEFGSGLIMSDIFAFGALYICDLSKVLKASDILENCNNDKIIRPEDYGEDKYKCFCGHSISADNVFRITNTDTGKWIDVGCDCIEKEELMSINKFRGWMDKLEEFKKERRSERSKKLRDKKKREKEEQEKIEEQKRIEEKLKEQKRIEEEKLKRIHAEYRQCVSCKKHKILKTEKSYVSQCGNCYGLEHNYRACVRCKEHTISPKTDTKFKKCYNCNNKIHRWWIG